MVKFFLLLFWPRKYPQQNLFVGVINEYFDKTEKKIY